jgi:hypothetical protein
MTYCLTKEEATRRKTALHSFPVPYLTGFNRVKSELTHFPPVLNHGTSPYGGCVLKWSINSYVAEIDIWIWIYFLICSQLFRNWRNQLKCVIIYYKFQVFTMFNNMMIVMTLCTVSYAWPEMLTPWRYTVYAVPN